MNEMGTSVRRGLGAAMLAVGASILALAPGDATAQVVSASLGGAGCPQPPNAAALRAGMLDAVNARRRAAGLAPLRTSAQLERAATVIACDNSRRGQMTHDAIREGGLRARLQTERYRFRRVSEALAHGHRDPGRLAGLWQGSAYHYPTLMTPTNTETGIAVVLAANGSPWWAMISAQPR